MKEIEEDAKNGEIICIHGWEELISLKCSLHPKWCTDSVQFILKFNGISTEIEKKKQFQNSYATRELNDWSNFKQKE